jgi:hypothetical protein
MLVSETIWVKLTGSICPVFRIAFVVVFGFGFVDVVVADSMVFLGWIVVVVAVFGCVAVLVLGWAVVILGFVDFVVAGFFD